MPNFRPSATVKSQGFFFQPGPVFSSDRNAAHRLYTGLFGEDGFDLSLDEAKARATTTLQALFDSAMEYRDLYISLRGNDVFWEIITNQTPLYYALTCEEVKVIIKAMAKARNDYRGNSPITPLIEVITRFIELEQHTAALPPPQTFTLSVRPAAAAEADRIIAGMASNMSAMNVTSAWPPAHFTPTDLIILADREVIAYLAGVDANNTVPRQPFPRADSRNSPTLLRLHLCHMALTRHSVSSDWTLFLSPVGFLHDLNRRNWHAVAGRQTKVFSTMSRFLPYVFDALVNRDQTFAVGMLAHWLLQSRTLTKVADLVRNDPTELWTDRELMRRYATLVIVRRIPTADMTRRVHIIWYDPWMHDGAVKKQYTHSQHAITEYRRQVVEGIKEWAAENGIMIEARYYGGPVSRDGSVAGDGVKQCFAYLEGLVSGVQVLPDAEDQAAFQRLGYVRSI
ncbi:hypothetical protein CONLIGDRAFT_694522 [Coniochaeta ligniaria NRRL 30616]|uniref:Uncharacterized protein n=1 Tax=Coniochaeta ligniaria NRRL 30616 TaxID=1408157 RepID=A0A1J7I6C2_9PEZI|nr:hypothetical protein CONLIGDRAFT_694522 [Coniochaeta ligniaria NRRL 30616]